MASPCPLCGLPYIAFTYPDGGSIELEAKPTASGYYAIRNGVPVAAVTFKDGNPVRLEGFEKEKNLYRGHYAECAYARARKAIGVPGKRAS